MKPGNSDPRLPDLTRAFEDMPADHPCREEHKLLPLQRAALPLLLWLFDPLRDRATGKSYVLAVAAIELAKRGMRVRMEEPSFEEVPYSRHSHFVNLVMRVAREHYPRDIFIYSRTRNELEYRGTRPE